MARHALIDRITHRDATAKLVAAPTVKLGDLSEFQSEVADAAYLAWSRAVILRAMYGAEHDDDAWRGGARREAFHRGGVAFLGIYQYIVAGQSVVSQAHALLELIGDLRPGEKLIADIEEGAGSQAGRWQAWARIIKAATGEQPWCYSGLDFAAEHGLTPEWVADYSDDEPRTPHLLWQFSETFEVPGVGVADCSLFRGSIDELAALAYQPARAKPAALRPAAPAVTPATIWRQAASLLPVLRAGDKDGGQPWMVRRVQALVNALGPDCAVTGDYDAATKAAVAVFQANHALPATGICDAGTWVALVTGRAA